MSISDLLKKAESPMPWRIDGDRILDAFDSLVGYVTGEDAKLIVALVNREYHSQSFDEQDDSFPNPFGENSLEEEMYAERYSRAYKAALERQLEGSRQAYVDWLDTGFPDDE